MSLGRQKPSEYFLGAILRGYDKSVAERGSASCADIWNYVCMECLRRTEGFLIMFEWDARKGNINRIGTIADCIKAGLVPGLELEQDERGRERVVSTK